MDVGRCRVRDGKVSGGWRQVYIGAPWEGA